MNPEDPNYNIYATAEGDEAGKPIKYYVKQLVKMDEMEKVTIFVDYSHMTSFPFQMESFISNITNEYGRFEPYLKKAATQFVIDNGY